MGEDSLPPETCSVAPRQLAKRLALLALKSVLRIEESLVLRGSRTCAATTVTSLWVTPGIRTTTRRDTHSVTVGTGTLATQCGGLLQRGADIASHLAQAYFERASVRQISCADLR